MASLDWSQCPAVESVPGKVSGAWVLKNTRFPVSVIFENLEGGANIDEIVEWFHVSREEMLSVLHFVTESLEDAPYLVKGPAMQADKQPEMADAHSV